MIDVVYSPGGSWGMFFSSVSLFVLVIGLIVTYNILIKLKIHISKKVKQIIGTVIFVLFFIAVFKPFNIFTWEGNRLSESQYETFITEDSFLKIESKDPKLKSDKMFFRIKKGTQTQFTNELKMTPLDEQYLTVYVRWSHGSGNTVYIGQYKSRSDSRKVDEFIVLKKSLNLQEK